MAEGVAVDHVGRIPPPSAVEVGVARQVYATSVSLSAYAGRGVLA
jgi:hypothetical protein